MTAINGEILANIIINNNSLGATSHFFTDGEKLKVDSGGGEGPLQTLYYHKRAWSTTLGSYVVWDTVTPNDEYPGGGTVYPLSGVILYTWTV
jgi:hypothetical protein